VESFVKKEGEFFYPENLPRKRRKKAKPHETVLIPFIGRITNKV